MWLFKLPTMYYIQAILGGVFLVYMAHSMWLMSTLFTNLKCTGFPCYKSFLTKNPKLQLAIFTSVTNSPISADVTKVTTIKDFDYLKAYER